MSVTKNTSIDEWFSSDAKFNQLYPPAVRELAIGHWTPLHVVKQASEFLAAEKQVRILDIGSGVGKFCLGAAYFKPEAFYFGVEQRKKLVDDAEKARSVLGLQNISFIHGNVTHIDFRQYNHFYFYNSFYENLSGTNKIDDSIDYSGELYNYYIRYLYKQLLQMPSGTRLATFHSTEDEIPEDFHVVGSDLENILKFWIKI